MPGPSTMDDIRDVERDVKDMARAVNETNQRIHGVELEMKGASSKLDLIFLAQNDHETRLRYVERATIKFAVWAAIIGAALSIVATQFARKFFDEANKPPPTLTDRYLEDGRRRIQEIQRENEAYLNRGKQTEGGR